MPQETKRPVGRPAADKQKVGFTLDTDLLPLMERKAMRDGYTHKRSGKANVSAWLNDLIRKQTTPES